MSELLQESSEKKIKKIKKSNRKWTEKVLTQHLFCNTGAHTLIHLSIQYTFMYVSNIWGCVCIWTLSVFGFHIIFGV